jgi:hypothetical protein
VVARFAQPAFELDRHKPFEPAQTKPALQWAVGWFVLLLAAAMDVLWHMDSMLWGDAAVSVLARGALHARLTASEIKQL